MTQPELHELCIPLRPFLGIWRGEGRGEYPTIEPFTYVEEVSFGHVGKPFLAYTQKTRHAVTNQPLHAEAGYLRALGGEAVELVIAQPSGIAETYSGSWADGVLELTSTAVITTPTAKDVSSVRRVVTVSADELRYDLHMGAVGQPEQWHLGATLRKVTS